jgi:hypothetical protein
MPKRWFYKFKKNVIINFAKGNFLDWCVL